MTDAPGASGDAGDGRRTRSQTRGRVVMLVDNTIDGDSRVQKEARAIADLGWDVVLIGRSRNRDVKRWRLGQARVIQLPTPRPLARRRHEYRRAPLRSPLAYPAGPLAAYRAQKLKAREVDVATRRAEIDADRAAGTEPGLLSRVRGVGLRLAHDGVRAQQRWVQARTSRTDRLRETRTQMDGPLDRATTALWSKLLGHRSWRRLDPGLWDWEISFGPEVDRLKPDIVHANDFRMLGVAVRAARRARARGREVAVVWDSHEFMPGMRPWDDHPRWHAAQIAHEAEYAPGADAVVAVSPRMAEMIAGHHGLAVTPRVVMNAPSMRTDPDRPVQGVKDRLGLAASTPLMVYSGVAGPHRGLDVMIESLPHLPGVHVALVVNQPTGAYVRELVARAKELEAADRLHVLGYVPVDDIVPFLAQADVGVIPIHRYLNYDVTLTTKFFEYAQARLPLVTSDVEATAALVREKALGEVFLEQDAEDYLRAARLVLDDLESYRRAYDAPGLLEEWTWDAQAAVLDEVYESVRPRR